MPGAYTQNFYHVVFSTKDRVGLITPEIEDRLYPFMGGIVRDLRCTLMAVNGMPDHVHLLVRYRPDLSHSSLLQQIKGRTSKSHQGLKSRTCSAFRAWKPVETGWTEAIGISIRQPVLEELA